MFDLILKYKKNIDLVTHIKAVDFKNQFLSVVHEDIKKSYIQNVHSSENSVVFKAPIGRFSWNGWNVFNPVSSGKFQIDIKKQIPSVYVELEFKEFFIIAVVMSITAVTPFVLGLYSLGIIFLLLNWLLFYALTKLITAIRIKSLINKIRIKINDKSIRFVSYRSLFKDDIDFVNQVFFNKDVNV
jgi:hypothetical protein